MYIIYVYLRYEIINNTYVPVFKINISLMYKYIIF